MEVGQRVGWGWGVGGGSGLSPCSARPSVPAATFTTTFLFHPPLLLWWQHTHTHTATQMVSFCPEEMASWFQEEQNGVAPENPWKSLYHFTIDAYQSHCYRCWKKMWHNLTIKNGWKDGWRGFCKCASTKWGKHLYPLLASHPPPCFVHLSDSDIPPLNEKSFLLWDVWGVFMYSLCHPTWREYDQDLGSTS